MKINKSLIIVILAALLGVGSLTSAFVMTNNRKARFNADGYCLEVVASETGTSVHKLSFATDVKYHESFPASYSYKDITNRTTKVNKESFIHYNDGSVSSFMDGVVVNMKEIAQGYMEFYSLEKGMVMARTAKGYNIDSNGHALPFDEICWELSEDTILLGGNSMRLTLNGQKEEKVTDFLEVRWIEDDIIQIATKDEAWQVVPNNCSVTFESGAKVDLLTRSVYSGLGNAMFTLDDMASELRSAIPVSSTSYLEWNIPQFNITTEDGKQGEDGQVGETGETGITGEDGEEGKIGDTGTTGAAGENGMAGTAGGRREEQLGGDADRLARINVGTVDTANPTTASFTLTVIDEANTLSAAGGVIEVRDAKNNSLIWYRAVDLSGATPELTYNVGGLEADHEYTIFVKHAYEADINGSTVVGSKVFSRRNFSTSSEGLSAVLDYVSQNKLGMTITKSPVFDGTNLGLRIWHGLNYYVDYPYDEEGESSLEFTPTGKIEIEEIEIAKLFKRKYPDSNINFDSDLEFNIEFLKNCGTDYDDEGNSVLVGDSCKPSLSGRTLKRVPVLGTLDIKTISAERGLYNLHCNVKQDVDDAINSYTFYIYDSYGILVDKLVSKSDVIDWSYGSILPLDRYKVYAEAQYYDNEKTVILDGDTNYIDSVGEDAETAITFMNYTRSGSNWLDEMRSVVKKYDNKASITSNRILGDVKITLTTASRLIDQDIPVVIQVRNNKSDQYFREWTSQVTRYRNRVVNTDRLYEYYFYVNMMDLSPDTEYYFTVYATTNSTVYGSVTEYTSSSLTYLGTVTVSTLPN